MSAAKAKPARKAAKKEPGRTAGSTLAQKLERIVEELEHLRASNETLAQRVEALETTARESPPPPREQAPRTRVPADDSAPPALDNLDGELRHDTCGPAVLRTSNSSHKNAVNKALSMLGLVPTEEDTEVRQRTSASHKRALNKALELAGKSPAPQDAGQEQTGSRAVAPQPRRRDGDDPGDAVAAPVESAPATEPEAEAVPEMRWETAERPDAAPTPDLEAAVPVELDRRGGLGSIAVGTLCCGVAGAAVALPPVAATGVAAGVFGLLAFFWRSASLHIRAAAAGAATMLLHALALHAAPVLPVAVAVLACVAASAAGAWCACRFRHPLVLFVGFLGAAGAARWLGASAGTLVFAVFTFAASTAAVYAAYRLQRLQAAVAILGATALLVTSPWAAAAMAAVHLGVALAAATRYRHPGRAPVVLAVTAFGLFAWTAHGLVAGPVLLRVGLLVLPAMVAAFASATIPRGLVFFSAALRASAVVLVLSVLPLGFSGPVLGGVALAVAMLFGAFALALDDAYLRAVGTLVLVAATAILLVVGATWFFLAGISAAALLLYGVPAKDGVVVSLLLGTLVVVAGLAALAVALPTAAVAGTWGVLALALGVTARRFPRTILRAGAVLAVGGAATWTLLFTPSPWALGAAAVLVLPHVWLLGLLRRPREAGPMLLLFELMAVATMQVIWPGPAGALAVLPLLLVLVLPSWGPMRHTVRTHARFLSFVLLVRCLFPDIRDAMGTPLGIAAAASAAACVALSLWLAGRAAPTRTPSGSSSPSSSAASPES